MMVVALKHVGTTAWLSEMLKMSVKTSVSSTAQSLSTRPGMFVRTRSMFFVEEIIEAVSSIAKRWPQIKDKWIFELNVWSIAY